MSNKPRILLVTHQFTPHVSPRTTRWSILCEELVERGYKVNVITGTRQNKEIKNNYRVIYFGSNKLGSVVDSVRKASNNTDGNNPAKKLIFYFLKRVYRLFYRTFAWPDYSMLWFFSVRRNRKNIPDYDLLISVSLPFTSHLVAYSINKSKKRKWIMDIGDPFYLKKDAPENNKYLFSYLNRHFENKFYNSADNVLFTHYESMKYHTNVFNVLDGRSSVLPPVYRINQGGRTIEFDYAKRPIKIAYFGVLTAGVRTPDNCIGFINNLRIKDLEIHWYMNEDSRQMVKKIDNKYINHIFHEMVPRAEALNLMSSEYHALLNIGNGNPFQLPSKVIEYISTGKPVIHFSEINDDPAELLLNERSNVIIISKKSDLENIKRDLYQKLFTDENLESFRKYNSHSVAETLINLI